MMSISISRSALWGDRSFTYSARRDFRRNSCTLILSLGEGDEPEGKEDGDRFHGENVALNE